MEEREPLAILIYGRPDCDDTEAVREWLAKRRIPFAGVNIDEDQAGDRFVREWNNGFRSTPTIVFGEGEFTVVEPTPRELVDALRRAGYRAEV